MKRYEYVRVVNDKLFGAKFDEHRKIIDEYARRGFSYVGYIPVNISDYGKFKEMDLIFEIEDK